MSVSLKCSKCKKSKILSNFEKMKNGKTKKICARCCLYKKNNLTIEDKAYLNIYKVHKELNKHFKPKRIKEYYQNYDRPTQIFCPVFKKQVRSCSHCNRPEEYEIETKTKNFHKHILKQIDPNIIFKPMKYRFN